MLNKIVLDSSAIAALFFKEKNSEWVEKIIASAEELFTVDLAFAEVANVAWKRIIVFGDNSNIIKEALNNAMNFIRDSCNVFCSVDLYKQAFELSLKLRIPVYDTLFLSLAVRLRCPLVTLDKKLTKRLQNTEYIKSIIHPYSSPN